MTKDILFDLIIRNEIVNVEFPRMLAASVHTPRRDGPKRSHFSPRAAACRCIK
ncbi:hypothetical protein T11_12184 [Trichinella zimbabwensis]|uniref:Uncharacterized protein n=1 Tax=Trichinella zimbabwensis TaxID=268475 RepID=A0A0V1GBE1_9BILA|nr:hypothetical protein T11_12184 [Trichinella zimbabwensis]